MGREVERDDAGWVRMVETVSDDRCPVSPWCRSDKALAAFLVDGDPVMATTAERWESSIARGWTPSYGPDAGMWPRRAGQPCSSMCPERVMGGPRGGEMVTRHQPTMWSRWPRGVRG
jgi:hypothetical protein